VETRFVNLKTEDVCKFVVSFIWPKQERFVDVQKLLKCCAKSIICILF